MGAPLARRQHAAARPAASRRAAQRKQVPSDAMRSRRTTYSMEEADVVLEGAASVHLTLCLTAALRPARWRLSRDRGALVGRTRSWGERVA
jgi:hypothetical protein